LQCFLRFCKPITRAHMLLFGEGRDSFEAAYIQKRFLRWRHEWGMKLHTFKNDFYVDVMSEAWSCIHSKTIFTLTSWVRHEAAYIQKRFLCFLRSYGEQRFCSSSLRDWATSTLVEIVVCCLKVSQLATQVTFVFEVIFLTLFRYQPLTWVLLNFSWTRKSVKKIKFEISLPRFATLRTLWETSQFSRTFCFSHG